MKPDASHPKCQPVGVRWTSLFAHFSIPVVLGLGLCLAALAIMMNCYSLMIAHERTDGVRAELQAMQSRLQAVEKEMKSLKSKTQESSSNGASPAR